MATTPQLAQAEADFQRADKALNTARSAVLRAERQFNRAREAGPGVDPGLLAQVTQNLNTARSNFQAADAAYTAAQQNFTAVFDAVDPTAASQADPAVTEAEARAQQQVPPLSQVQFRPDPFEVDGADLGVTDEDIFAQDNPIAPEDTEDEFAGNGYGFEYNEDGELVPGDSAEADRIRSTPDDTAVDFAGDGYGFDYDEDGNLIPSDSADDIAPVPENTSPIPPLSDLSYEDNGDGTGFTVYDSDGQVVQVFDTEQDAEAYIFQQQNASSGFGTYPTTDPFGFDEASLPPAAVTQQSQAQIQAAAQQARAQKAMAVQRAEASQGDWRVRLRLAGASDYLYKAADPGILQPLAVTDGVIFPYTPQITTGYSANYSTYDLTHSNYRGVFYQNSTVDELQIQATFTAQDTFEANYLLAVIHFFRSVTKMFYGQDPNRGVPPPLVFLQGLGEFQYNLHPCVVKTFNYTTPNDVDYIRARTSTFDGTGLLRQRRDRQTNSAGSGELGILDLVAQRRNNAGLPPGGQTITPAPPTLGTASPTYVPTKLDISLALLPVQTRRQVSQEFSLEKFANGTLIKGGFW